MTLFSSKLNARIHSLMGLQTPPVHTSLGNDFHVTHAYDGALPNIAKQITPLVQGVFISQVVFSYFNESYEQRKMKFLRGGGGQLNEMVR